MKMTIGSRKRIVLPTLAAVFTALIVVTVWFSMPNANPTPHNFASFDFPVYSSVEELTNVSDVVIIGSVKGIVGREIDYGTANPEEEYGVFMNQIHGIATVYYEIAVAKTLKGETAETIIMASMDMNQTVCDQVTPLRAGEEVLLFLNEISQKDAPGCKLYDHFYVTVSLDNGVFDVRDNNTVQPRYEWPFRKQNADGTFTSPDFNLTEVCKKIQPVK